MLNPDPDQRPDIFEVLTLVFKLRGLDCPVAVCFLAHSSSVKTYPHIDTVSKRTHHKHSAKRPTLSDAMRSSGKVSVSDDEQDLSLVEGVPSPDPSGMESPIEIGDNNSKSYLRR